MDAVILTTTGLQAVCIVVAILARRVHLPYTVGLILTGIGIALLRFRSDLNLTRVMLAGINKQLNGNLHED